VDCWNIRIEGHGDEADKLITMRLFCQIALNILLVFAHEHIHAYTGLGYNFMGLVIHDLICREKMSNNLVCHHLEIAERDCRKATLLNTL
jgi:hypothetical protein